MSRGTDRRTVRVAPELWEAAQAVAAEHGEHVSDVIRRDLIRYVREQPAITKALAAERIGRDRDALVDL